jgi:hypothetical protein
MKKPEQLAILTEACQHPLGAVVETNDPNRLRQRFYAMRRAHPEFEHLSFVVPADGDGTVLYIIARTGDDNVQS